MKTLSGFGVSPGFAAGEIYSYDVEQISVQRKESANPQNEHDRLAAVLEAAKKELEAVLTQAIHSVGEKEAEIFSVQLLILEDPELLDNVAQIINTQGCNAEFAWFEGTEYYANLLSQIDDPYLAARSADVRDVAQRVLRLLTGKVLAVHALKKPVILVAEELTPSDTVTLDKSKLLAFCTAKGGPTSHVAILSKALGIPAISGLGEHLSEIRSSRFAVVDGSTGDIILDPDESTLHAYRQRSEETLAKFEAALALAIAPALTLDGHAVEVVANIGSAGDARQALTFGAEGVGLLRTEFLFLDRESEPDEQEQFLVYRQILEIFEQKPVVVRTLDIGGDKPAPYLKIDPELNPFLGVRGTRLALAYPRVFQTQLRALLRAGQGHNLKVMFPMVSTLAEIEAIYRHLDQARADLSARGEEFADNIEIGIMVEVPSAALMADVLAKHVDFFSIGTNDLTQYTLACDRTNAGVTSLADALDPAVLRLIHMVAQAAHENGRWVGLCGELAGDPLAAAVLLGLGIDEFSMNPRAVPYVKETLRRLRLEDAQRLAEAALQMASSQEVRQFLETQMDVIHRRSQ